MKKNYGAALVEMLVSVLIISICIFAITNQSLLCINFIMRTHDGAIASVQLQNLESYLQVYSEAQLEEVKAMWQADVKNVLPNAKTFISGHYPFLSAQIIWDQSVTQCNHINQHRTCLQQKIHLKKRVSV